MNREINAPAPVRRILDILESGGFEGFVVGGCVRDHLLGIKPKDWDITTNAVPEQIKAAFADIDDIHTVDTGIKHGTVTVVIDHIGYEVTTYRIDGEYKDSRHPESVEFTSDITADLARRDFTMNAVAYNPKRGFIDPFNGRGDIESRLIRGVGNAAARFEEDALRIMRAVRFAAQLGFDIEEKTYAAVFEKAELIKNISTERIREEFTKTLMSERPDRLSILDEAKVLEMFIKNLVYTPEQHGRLLTNSSPVLPVRLALLLADSEFNDVNGLLKSLTYDNETARMTAQILKFSQLPQKSAYDIRLLISKAGEYGAKLVLLYSLDSGNASEQNNSMEIYDNILRNGDCCSTKQLALTGNDLQALGVPRGKQIGELLNAALDAVLHDPSLNEKDKLKEYLKL